jgi:glycine cleavage system H protein
VADINNCNVPEDLYYLVERHVWARPEDGQVTVGLTDVAQNLAKNVLSVTVKAVGKQVKQGRSLATVESSKWVGPVPCPVGGEVVAVNDAVVSRPTLLNEDPYGEGWIVKIAPTDWEGESTELVTGADGVEAYRAFLDAEGISCT